MILNNPHHPIAITQAAKLQSAIMARGDCQELRGRVVILKTHPHTQAHVHMSLTLKHIHCAENQMLWNIGFWFRNIWIGFIHNWFCGCRVYRWAEKLTHTMVKKKKRKNAVLEVGIENYLMPFQAGLSSCSVHSETARHFSELSVMLLHSYICIFNMLCAYKTWNFHLVKTNWIRSLIL